MVVLSTSPTRLITRNSGNKHSLANNNVNFVIECDDSNIWYATDRESASLTLLLARGIIYLTELL